METKQCPLCRGNQFFTSTAIPYTDGIMLRAFKGVSIYATVCLSCGLVAPTLDAAGLAAVRELASTHENELREKPSGEDFGDA